MNKGRKFMEFLTKTRLHHRRAMSSDNYLSSQARVKTGLQRLVVDPRKSFGLAATW